MSTRTSALHNIPKPMGVDEGGKKDMRIKWRSIALVGGLLLAVALPSQLSAQSFQGQITGTIEDEQGASVPGATVTLRNENTGETRTQVSTHTGTVVFPNLLVGSYTMTVELTGFKKYERRDILVKANTNVDVKTRLAIGGVEDVITVVGGAELVKTTSSQLEGGSFDAKAIRDLPIMQGGALDGDAVNFAILAPGVGTMPGGMAGAGGVIGGNRPRQNNFVVDGLDNNDPSVTGPLVPVIQDSVAEFALLTNQFNAEFGHSTAGQFVSTLKSGTNDFRGGAWGYVLNRHFNSLDNITRATAVDDPDFEKPRYDRQRAGAQLGGPIVRDKWFFYGAYEYRNLNQAGSSSGQILVPTAGGLATLEALAGQSGSGISPLNVGILRDHVPTATSPITTVNVLNEGTGQLVPIAVGAFSATTPNYQREHLGYFSTDYQTGSHRFSGRFSYFQLRSIGAGELPTPDFNDQPSTDTKRGTLSWVWTPRATVVNELRGGFTDNKNDWPVPGLPAGPGGLDVFGNYNIDELSLFIGPDSNFPQSGQDRLWQVSNTTAWIKGNHSFKFGAEFRRIVSSSDFLPRARGENGWSTLDLFVRDTIPDAVTIRGVGEAAFDQDRDSFYSFVQDNWRIGSRLRLDLGLRYEWTGVAKDSALQDLNNFASIVDVRTETDADGNNIFNSLSPFHQQRILDYVGESLIFQKPKSDKNNFSPRFGFAWDVKGDGTMSVRGGFAWTYDVVFGNLPLLQLPPQAQAENRGDTNACLLSPAPAWCAVGGGGHPGGENVRYITGGYLGGGGLLPTFDATASVDRDVARALAGSYVADEVSPEALTWTLAFQRELARDLMVELRYIGNRGRKLPVQRWVNAGLLPTGGAEALGVALPIFLNEGDALGRNFAGAPTRADFVEVRDGINGLILQPYGFFGTLTEFPAIGESWYHGGSIALTKRFSKGFALNANYTLSKTTDWIENELFTSYLNPRRPENMTNPELDKGESGLSKRHKAVLSWQWDLPKPASKGFLNALLSNWSWNGIFLFETGQALTVISRTDTNGDFDSAGDRAWENPNGRANVGTGVNFVCWGDGRAYVSPTSGGCGGNSGVVGYVAQDPNAQFVSGALGAVNGFGLQPTKRGNVFGPGNIVTVNMSLYKSIPLGGDARLRLGVQVLNLTNTPSFALASASAFGSTTAATTLPGYVQPTSPQFLDQTIFSGSLGQAPFQRMVQFEARFDF
jgi:Carboxypeptidase regulatory-like domain/TonB dependent receptor